MDNKKWPWVINYWEISELRSIIQEKLLAALKLWSSIRRGFPAQVFREAGFIVH